MRKWLEHLAVADPILPHSILHHCLAAGVVTLVTEAFEDAAGGVFVLRRCLAVVLKDLPDHWHRRLNTDGENGQRPLGDLDPGKRRQSDLLMTPDEVKYASRLLKCSQAYESATDTRFRKEEK